jgi:hypothetical protein
MREILVDSTRFKRFDYEPGKAIIRTDGQETEYRLDEKGLARTKYYNKISNSEFF